MSKGNRGKILFFALLAVFIAAGAVAVYNIVGLESAYSGARQEYEELRALSVPESSQDTLDAEVEHERLRSVNSDYVGWVRIQDSTIDYPIVRGQDNEHYLTTTFSGEKNASGAVFMDSGNLGGFSDPFVLVFGHNMKDGSMFAGLNDYRKADFAKAHPEVEITTPENGRIVFKVLDARLTDTKDETYMFRNMDDETRERFLEALGASPGTQLLVLSTCTSGADDERMLIIAARE